VKCVPRKRRLFSSSLDVFNGSAEHRASFGELPGHGRQLQAQHRVALRLPSRLQGLLSSPSKSSQVKSSNNSDYRVNPVYGFLEPKGNVALEIIRTSGQAKQDKLVVQWAEVPAEEQDPKAPFAAGAQAGEVILPLKAE